VFAVSSTNFALGGVFARGLYTPFLCWFLYTLPALMHTADMPYSALVGVFVVFEARLPAWARAA
jgi:hypothetical protein